MKIKKKGLQQNEQIDGEADVDYQMAQRSLGVSDSDIAAQIKDEVIDDLFVLLIDPDDTKFNLAMDVIESNIVFMKFAAWFRKYREDYHTSKLGICAEGQNA